MDIIPELFRPNLEKYLSQTQLLTLQILIWLLQVHKDVKIERLAGCLPLPILYESRRKHLKRFLVLKKLSVVLIRLNEAKRSGIRHSNFWVGLYGYNWIITWEFCYSLVDLIMKINSHKNPYYRQGMKAMDLIKKVS
jgi:hypothetical protein